MWVRFFLHLTANKTASKQKLKAISVFNPHQRYVGDTFGDAVSMSSIISITVPCLLHRRSP